MAIKSIAGKIVRNNWTRWGLVISGVAAIAAAGTLTARSAQGAEQTSVYKGSAATAVRTAMVAEGQISASLSYTGDLKAGAQVSLLPKASGRLERMAVEVGTRVKKGDVIAELETANLQSQLTQAQANLAAAEAKYASMESGSRAEQVAQANANLVATQQRYAAMVAGGREEQVAQAQAALDAARAKAATVKKGATEADLQAAQGAADGAAANLAMAKARLETVKQGPTQSEWGNALAAVDTARANQRAAEARLAEVKAGPKLAEIQAAVAAVEQARAAKYVADDRKAIAGGSQPEEVKYAAGATSGSAMERAAVAAEAAFQAAQEKLNLLHSMPLPAEVAAAQSGVDSAKAAVMAAEFHVDQMKRGATREDLQQAQAAVEASQATLASSQARFHQVKGGPTEEDLVQVDSAVAQAEQNLALAQKPFRREDLVQAQTAVTVADQQYQLVLHPYTDNDLAMVQATVQQARAGAEMAQLALSEAVVVSPIDGIVAERFQTAGALVSPATPLVSLVSNDVELLLGVDEAQIGQIQEGQRVDISVAAYPGTLFPAKVALIAPVADPKSRTFQIKVKPEDPNGKLRQGMFAQAKLVTQEKDRAVLVPQEAVVARAGQTSVFVLKGDTAEQRPVTLGVRYNGSVEVLTGVNPGEEVIVAGQNDLRAGDPIRKA